MVTLTYLPADPDTMLYWLGRTCREARRAQRRKSAHVAASLDVSESTIVRFEGGHGWPRNPDRTVRAYAEDLDLSERELWQTALSAWIAAG